MTTSNSWWFSYTNRPTVETFTTLASVTAKKSFVATKIRLGYRQSDSVIEKK